MSRSDPTRRDALPAGTSLREYTLDRVVGHGGFGIVYQARHKELAVVAAIKEYLPIELAIREGTVVRPRSGSDRLDYEDGLRRFRDEARALMRFCDHPTIVTCREFFQENGTAYLVMEYEEGLPLAAVLATRESAGRPFEEADLLSVMVPLIEGLRDIHEAGLLHRDIKPSNILIRNRDERPVLIDFGTAKQLVAKQSKSMAPFTEGYAALEQVADAGELGPWTDLYGVGAVMWRMVAGGQRPWEPPHPVRVERRSHAAVANADDPLPSARLLGKNRFSRELLDAIDACLHLRENERVQNCRDLLHLLRAARSGSVKILPDQASRKSPTVVVRRPPSQRSHPKLWGFLTSKRIPLVFRFALGWPLARIYGLPVPSRLIRDFRQPDKMLIERVSNAVHNDPLGVFALAEMYYSGRGIVKDHEQAAKWYKSAAERGHTQSQYRLGCLYHHAEGVMRDDDSAIRWWQISATDGNVLSQFELATLYETWSDYTQAAKWHSMAAEQGHPVSQHQIAESYAHGYGVVKDKRRALKWHRKAAEQGHEQSQYEVGEYYYHGTIVLQDRAASAKWYRRAAKQGHSLSKYMIGMQYFHGHGVNKDPKTAALWLGRAAEDFRRENSYWKEIFPETLAECYFMLGELYETGVDAPMDKLSAYKWYDLSKGLQQDISNLYEELNLGEESEDEDQYYTRQSAKRRDRIAEILSHNQTIMAQRMVSEYQRESALPNTCDQLQTRIKKLNERFKEFAAVQFDTKVVPPPSTVPQRFEIDTSVHDEHTRTTIRFILRVKKASAAWRMLLFQSWGRVIGLDVSGRLIRDLDSPDDEFTREVLAAIRGDASAQYEVGIRYAAGVGVVADSAEATHWTRRSAEQGHPGAQYFLGFLYYIGYGVERDSAQATSLCRLAVQQGSPAERYVLGDLSCFGNGTKEDHIEATKWYDCIVSLGRMTSQKSHDTPQRLADDVGWNCSRATMWYRSIAVQCDAWAQYCFAVQCASGDGAKPDYLVAAKWYRLAANQGHSESQYQLAWLYDCGKGVAQNFTTAATWYRRAAEQGDDLAQCRLATMYCLGEGVQQDLAESAWWYRRAAEQGDELSRACLIAIEGDPSTLYELASQESWDDRERIKWFKLAANRGHHRAQYQLGWCFYIGREVEKSYELAAKWFRMAANQGHADAQKWTGDMYSLGQGVAQDKEAAVDWYKLSAKQGNPDAQCALADKYRYGTGVEENHAEAARWYRAAADQGDMDAQCELGMLFYGGNGVDQDFSEAARWFQKAAMQIEDGGDVIAQYMLGMLFYYGKGVKRNISESIAWIRKAAEHGESDAQLMLGNFYYRGEGVEPDYVEAAKWYECAALQSVLEAQFELGKMHELGKGVVRDYVIAYKWYYLASSGEIIDDPDYVSVWNLFEPSRYSLVDAVVSRDRVANMMSKIDILRARDMIEDHRVTIRSKDAEMKSLLARA